MNAQLTYKKILLIGLLLFSAFSRLIPHPPNFTALGAMALFGGAYLSNKFLVILLPLFSLWVSDLIINNYYYADYYTGIVLFPSGHIWIYLSFAIIAIIGSFSLKKISIKSVGYSSLYASVIFYLLSNFGVWLQSTMYPPTFSGLITCYVAAIPFFGYTIMGNTIYCLILFGTFELANNKISALNTN